MLDEAAAWCLAAEDEDRDGDAVAGADETLVEDARDELVELVAPALIEQTGQAPHPCRASTFSAIAICVDLLAAAGLPRPPKPRQVARLNCRPP